MLAIRAFPLSGERVNLVPTPMPVQFVSQRNIKEDLYTFLPAGVRRRPGRLASPPDARVLVCSSNKAKILAAQSAFQTIFDRTRFTINGVDCKNGVAPQPLGLSETVLGAQNRLGAGLLLAEKLSSYDWIVSFENGLWPILDSNEQLQVFDFGIALLHNPKTQKTHYHVTGGIKIPDNIAERFVMDSVLRQRVRWGDVFLRSHPNMTQDKARSITDPIWLLSDKALLRKDLLALGLELAIHVEHQTNLTN